MIHFVLKSTCEEALALDRLRVAIAINSRYDDLLGTLHHCGKPGKAQAAFFGLVRALGPAQHGIDEDQLLVVRAGVRLRVDHEQPPGQIDLIGRQPDALMVVHRVNHVLHQLVDGGVYHLDPPRLLA